MNGKINELKCLLVNEFGYDLTDLRKSYDACLDAYDDKVLALKNYELILKAGIEELRNNKV